MKPSSFKLPSQDFVLSISSLTHLGLVSNGLIAKQEFELNKERERLKKAGRCTMGFDVKFGRRKLAVWIAEQLYGVEGIIYNADGEIIWRNDIIERADPRNRSDDIYTIDRAFNDDESFRWLSTLSKYATNPPKYNRLASVQYRMELITAAFIISGLYQPEIEGWDNPFVD